MKKRIWISIVLLLALSIFGYPGDTLTIQIKSKGKKTYPVFNGKQFKNPRSGRLKRILGQPYEIVIQPAGLFSMRSVSFNYFRSGLIFSGPRRSKLYEAYIDLDTLTKYSKKTVLIEVAGFRFGTDFPILKLDSVKARGYSEKALFPFSYLVSDSTQKLQSDTTLPMFKVIFQKEHILLVSSGTEILLWFDMRFHLKRMRIFNTAFAPRRLGRRH